MNTRIKRSVWAVLSVLAAPAAAQDVYLVAREFTQTLPDGTPVVMWGFAQDQDGNFGTTADQQPPSVPGPLLRVDYTDPELNIHLHNTLGAPVSLMIPGQQGTDNTPTWLDAGGNAVSGARPNGDVTSRVRSFVTETPPGGTHIYRWPNLRPGSYAYRSGTQPQVQIQMGLYGGVVKDAANQQAYNGQPYSSETVLFYSEIDPALHAAVANGSYGTPVYPSTLDYKPKYFLVNGAPYQPGDPTLSAGASGGRTLLRLFNMGLRSHSMVLNNADLELVAEDGNLYPYPRRQYSVMLPAGKTRDAIFSPAQPGIYPFYDRMLNLSNAGQAPGGMIARLEVASGQQLSLSSNNLDFGSVTVGTTAATTIVLSNTGTSVASIQAISVSSGDFTASDNCPSMLNPAADCDIQINFTPTQPDAHSATLTIDYLANGTTQSLSVALGGSAVASPQASPSATGDAYATDEDASLNIAAPGVLANDSDPNNEPLSAMLVTGPAHGTLALNANGSFSYTPAPDFNGNDAFSYRANNGTLTSGIATVTLTITPVNDAPVAAADAYQATTASTLSVSAPGVLGNDSDVDGDTLSAVLSSGPTGGSLSLNPDGSFSYTPDGGTTSDSFSYVASDGAAQSQAVTVTLSVGNSAPEASDDSAETMMNTTVIIDVLINDTDPDGNLDPGSVTAITPPSMGGTATVNPDGTISYTPRYNFRGTDVFTYQVSDQLGAVSNEATVRVNVLSRPRTR